MHNANSVHGLFRTRGITSVCRFSHVSRVVGMPVPRRTLTATMTAIFAAGVVCVAATTVAQSRVPKSQKVLECLAQNIPDHGGIATLAITSHGSSGATSRYRWRVYWRSRNGRRAAVIRVTAPPAVAGSAYLVRQTDKRRKLYWYTPAIGTVRRIRSDAGGSRRLFGTDVTLREVLSIGRILAHGTLTYMGEEKINGRTVDHMLALPPPGPETPYSRISVFIGQDPCVIWRLEFSQGNGASKVYTAVPGSLKQTPSGLWYPARWTLGTSQNQKATTIRVTNLETVSEIVPGRFQPQSFYR